MLTKLNLGPLPMPILGKDIPLDQIQEKEFTHKIKISHLDLERGDIEDNFRKQLKAIIDNHVQEFPYLQGKEDFVRVDICDQYLDVIDYCVALIIQCRYLKWDPDSTKNISIFS